MKSEVLTFDSREAWLAARRELGVGSSDVPAILGLSRYASPLSLYYDKVGQREPPPAYAESARWGQILEGPIAQRFQEEVKRIIAAPAPGKEFSLYTSEKYPHATASVDRLMTGKLEGAVPAPAPSFPGVLEIKNAHFVMRDQWSEDSNNEPPVAYQVQLQHQLAVTGLEWGSIAAVIGGCEFKWADIKRDQALIDKIEASVAEFWRRVELKDPPPADGLDATADVLAAIYPKDKGTSVALSVDAFEWSGELEAAKAARKAAEDDIALYGNKLRQAIGDNTIGLLPDGSSYSYRHQARKGYVVEPTEFRVLRFSKSK